MAATIPPLPAGTESGTRRAAGGDPAGQLLYSLPRWVREGRLSRSSLPPAVLGQLPKVLQQLVAAAGQGMELVQPLTPLAAAWLQRRSGMTDVQYDEWQRTFATILPSRHYVRQAFQEQVPALAPLPGIEDGCSLADPLELVRRKLLAWHAKQPLEPGTLVCLSTGLDGHSIELHNGQKRSMVQLSGQVVKIGSQVPADALSNSHTLPLAYAADCKEEDGFAAMLRAWQQGLEALPAASSRLEGANGARGPVVRFLLVLDAPSGGQPVALQSTAPPTSSAPAFTLGQSFAEQQNFGGNAALPRSALR